MKSNLIEKESIKDNGFNEYRDVSLYIILSVVLFFLINDIDKYEVIIHCIYATFLISTGTIVLNTSRYRVETTQIFLGICAIIIGSVECIFVIRFLTYMTLPIMMPDTNIIVLLVTDITPIMVVYLTISHIKNNKTIKRSLLELLIFLGVIIASMIVFKYINLISGKTVPYFTVRAVTTLVMLAISYFVFRDIKTYKEVIVKEELMCFKRVVIVLLISTIPTLFYPLLGNLTIIDVVSQSIINISIYYIFRYMVYVSTQKTANTLEYTNKELKARNELLLDKNKKLIKYGNEIAKLRKEFEKKEDKLKMTLDLSSNGIVVYNLKKDIAFSNTVFEREFIENKYEYEIDDYIVNYDDLMNSYENVCKDMKEVINRAETVDNRTFEVKMSPLVVDGKLQGILGVFKDKTKKLESEAKIKEANEKYEKFLESVGDAIVVVYDDKVIYKNEACKYLFKEKVDEIDFLECYKKEIKEKKYRVGKDIIHAEFDYSSYKKGDKLTYIIAIRDVTERMMLKINLEDLKRSYQTFIDVLPDGICILDGDFNINYVNKSLIDLFEFESIYDMKRKRFDIFIDSSLKYEDIKKLILKSVATNTALNMIPHEIILSTGEHKEIEITILPFPIDENNAMIIIRDLEHKRKYEIVEAELNERFKADRIKTEFFANMSHELKTPLNVISSSNQLVDSFFRSGKIEGGESTIEGHIDLVKQSTYRLQRLINNIIDLTKMESGFYNLRSSYYNVVEVVEDLFMRIEKYTSKKGLSIVFDTQDEELYTYIDKLEFERVLLNILSNCIKFTDNGGTIDINIYEENGFIYVCVKDSGVGIPEDKLETIFEEFSQVDKTLSRSAEGSGIGLSIVKKLIELHEGDIEVISHENKGTKFTIKLPIKDYVDGNVSDDKRIYNLDERIKIEFSDIYY